MKKFLAGAAATAVMLSSFAGVAFASEIPENFPGDNGISCNAWHGAPGGFGPESPYSTLPPYFSDDVLGSARGGLTGENNSNYSEYCQSL